MCGRFALVTEKKILEMLYQLEIREDLRPRYNIAPSQDILALRRSPEDGNRELVSLKWGLVPFWAKDASIGNRMINARSETAAEKPSFRNAFKKRRLLIPASGFFEWKKEGGARQPYYVYAKNNRPFSLAGLWERWDKGEQPIESCTILTTEPNNLLVSLHDRMPVIIMPGDFEKWLDPLTASSELHQLLKPYPPGEMVLHPVSRQVNKSAHDSPELIEPL